MSKTGSKNHVQSSPWVNLTELNLEQGLYFFPNFELSAIVYINYITGNKFFMDAFGVSVSHEICPKSKSNHQERLLVSLAISKKGIFCQSRRNYSEC